MECMRTSRTTAEAPERAPRGPRPATGSAVRGGPARSAVLPRTHLQSMLTLGLALLILAVGWADVADFPWWDAVDVEPQLWWHLGPLLAMAATLLLRVRRPVLSLVLGLGLVLVDLAIGLNLGILLCLSDLVYSLGIRAPRRTVRTAGASFLACILGAAILFFLTGADARSSVSLALGIAAVLLVPLWWATEVRRGVPLWQEADARDQLNAERHPALLRAQTRQRRQAVEEERRRMAQELHDVISSQVSAIALTSGAVLNAEADRERDRGALQTIRETSVDALEQLREMVQLLRGGSGHGRTAHAQKLTSLEDGAMPGSKPSESTTWQDVLNRAASHGLQITVQGHLPASLSPTNRQVLLRVLQESLTNVLKHGDGAAEVRVSSRGRRLRLTVTSPGTPPAGTPEVNLGAGTGLLTMRERVLQAGGRFRAGPHPRDHSGWRVQAEIPIRESPE